MFREGTIYSSQCCNSIHSDFLVNQYNYLSDNFDICVISACVCSSAITTSSGMQQCSNIAMQQCSICNCKNKFSNDMDNVGMCEHKIEDNRYKVTVYGRYFTFCWQLWSTFVRPFYNSGTLRKQALEWIFMWVCSESLKVVGRARNTECKNNTSISYRA